MLMVHCARKPNLDASTVCMLSALYVACVSAALVYFEGAEAFLPATQRRLRRGGNHVALEAPTEFGSRAHADSCACSRAARGCTGSLA